LNYLEFKFLVNPAIPGSDLLISALAEIGFESFEELPTGCKAWIPSDLYDAPLFDELDILNDPLFTITYEVGMIEGKNWNAEWESGFEPVIVDECIIRAPFHPPAPTFRYEIVVLPQMSFGTGHHETTSLMVEKLLTLDLEGKSVLDMGCGTGVLAILASKRGAAKVLAIDNNDNAVENTRENLLLNGAEGILVHKGDAGVLQGKIFQVILANINRNVLLADMEIYSACLEPGGKILLSGFFETDIPLLIKCCLEHNLIPSAQGKKNEWALLEFIKN
jgi:ribosomal protein L11 methyltransferase